MSIYLWVVVLCARVGHAVRPGGGVARDRVPALAPAAVGVGGDPLVLNVVDCEGAVRDGLAHGSLAFGAWVGEGAGFERGCSDLLLVVASACVCVLLHTCVRPRVLSLSALCL